MFITDSNSTLYFLDLGENTVIINDAKFINNFKPLNVWVKEVEGLPAIVQGTY